VAFLQFVFMGIVFLAMFVAVTQQVPPDVKSLRFFSDRCWPAMVASHILSTFWLQSLMMPAQTMSLGYFAATRALEIPMASVIRPVVLGRRFGLKTLQTSAFAFGAACHLYFAYAELAGCICILSGNGVVLTGMAFWIIYAMVLAMPATNAACQESLIVQPGAHPLLILGFQNILASFCCLPILLGSHYAGWENIAHGFQLIFSQPSVLMLVIWLCAQITLTSIVCIMLIHVADSFWAVALRPVRVVLWALAAFLHSYVSSR
jgi:hypothetical protein